MKTALQQKAHNCHLVVNVGSYRENRLVCLFNAYLSRALYARDQEYSRE